MSAREQMQKLAEDSNVSTKFVMDMLDRIIEVVKEECCSGSQRWEVVADFMEKKEPELIQGYTAEQWQEIIDGGYLCEFKDSTFDWIKPKMKLKLFMPKERCKFNTENLTNYPFCRPAQIKGVLRPIFVEPVDKSSMCIFFCKDGYPLNEIRSRAAYSIYLHRGSAFKDATKYIEV